LLHSNQQCNKVQSILVSEYEIKAGPLRKRPCNRAFYR